MAVPVRKQKAARPNSLTSTPGKNVLPSYEGYALYNLQSDDFFATAKSHRFLNRIRNSEEND